LRYGVFKKERTAARDGFLQIIYGGMRRESKEINRLLE